MSSSSSLGSIGAGDAEQWIQQPCEALTYASGYNGMDGLDYGNPCAAGDCLIAQHCSSGGCRLEDLGGSWICCQCNSRGNTLRLCVRPLRKIPDALCYHAPIRSDVSTSSPEPFTVRMLLRHHGGCAKNGGLVSGFSGMLYLGRPRRNSERNVLWRIVHSKNVGVIGIVVGVARSGTTKVVVAV
ncbi:uncharacterized protein F4807DRAFT_465488 [Annulohypoxylon truncatum]|uniref:uncharacterized protein n=1 Tax=Annulohypoxylon truncatum TaxID=327061 RepID=UPI002007D0DD|nr:uncharacterized protein F4807DRAFT_465488 [Annulohypoxylon truncatum]KAI1204577.1 hypothetical protein F4807DRAFT_465488 [Annulohypoxylon truncatum]